MKNPMIGEQTTNDDHSAFQLIFLVKFLKKKKHVDEFLDGLLYANRLKYFRNIEDPLRGDKNEGGILLEDAELCVRENEEWLPFETAGPIRVNHSNLDDLNVFCMTAFRYFADRGPTQEMIEEVNGQIRDCLRAYAQLGKHAVLVRDFRQFVIQVGKAATNAGYQYWYRPVEYYDAYPHDVASRAWKPRVRPAFLKSKAYKGQREFRIVLNTATHGEDPLRLDIGSIRDISHYIETTSLSALRWRITQKDYLSPEEKSRDED